MSEENVNPAHNVAIVNRLLETDLLTPNHDGTPEHYVVEAENLEQLVDVVLIAAAEVREAPAITAPGGWCGPVADLFPAVSVARGGIRFPTAEEAAADAAARADWLHRTRWNRRRAKLRSWVRLRPVRDRIHERVHHHCEEY